MVSHRGALIQATNSKNLLINFIISMIFMSKSIDALIQSYPALCFMGKKLIDILDWGMYVLPLEVHVHDGAQAACHTCDCVSPPIDSV